MVAALMSADLWQFFFSILDDWETGFQSSRQNKTLVTWLVGVILSSDYLLVIIVS